MFDLILFGTIGLLLLVLIGFLVIVIRDHMRSRSFDLYVQQSHEALQEEFDRSIRERAQPRKADRTDETHPSREATEREKAVEPAPPPKERPAERKVDLEVERNFRKNLRKAVAQAPLEGWDQESPSSDASSAPATAPTERTVAANPPKLTPAQRQAQKILRKDYGPFSHQRLVESMGLSPEEADEFVVELIHQLEGAINDLDAAIAEKRYEDVEHITHGLKGAALNIGEGGVAQLLIDYNTYMKHGTEQPIVEAYQTLLKRTVSDLKIEYSQVA